LRTGKRGRLQECKTIGLRDWGNGRHGDRSVNEAEEKSEELRVMSGDSRDVACNVSGKFWTTMKVLLEFHPEEV